jgi:hypothetical protein
VKFVAGLVLGFVAAHLDGFSGAMNKLADGLEFVADKLNAWADKTEENEG